MFNQEIKINVQFFLRNSAFSVKSCVYEFNMQSLLGIKLNEAKKKELRINYFEINGKILSGKIM